MKSKLIKNEYAGSYTKHQQLFFRYMFLILVDLTILNLYAEFFENVYVASFSLSLAAAILLQFMLQITISLEHKVSKYFKAKEGLQAKVLRGLSVWGILFFSKLLILEALSFVFTEGIVFTGRVHGIISFVIVIVSMIIAEQLMRYIYMSLGEKPKKEKD